MMSAENRSSSHVRPDSYVQTHGGSNEYSTTKVVLTELSGKTHERENVPIPLPFGKEVKFPNLQPVAALCAQVVRNTQGVWESGVSTIAWGKTFKSVVNVVGMQLVATVTCAILTDNSVWKGMTTLQKNAIQGNELMSFVANALNGLDPLAYWTLNCLIVFNGLRAFEDQSGKWVHVLDDKGQKMVSSEVYTFVSQPDILAQMSGRFPAVAQYNGRVSLIVDFPEGNGSFEAARLSQARLREVQGPDTSCTAILASMRGYSGLTDAFGRRLQFIVSAVLSAWRLRRSVVVQLSTVGDLSMLISSLNHWKRKIRTADLSILELFPSTSQMAAEQDWKCSVSYLLPSANDKRKVPSTLHGVLVHKIDSGVVVVGYDEGNLPTSDKKDTKVDYDAFSSTLVPDFVGQQDYVLYSAIFGDYVFPADPEVARHRDNSLKKPLQINYKEPRVHRFGIAAGFRGILTSLPNFSLIGFGNPPSGSGFDRTRKVLHSLSCPLVPTMKAWYSVVCDDCSSQVMMFLCPVVRYSGISNLLRQSKEAAVMQLRIVPMEEGLSLPSSVGRIEKVAQPVVDFSVQVEPQVSPTPFSPSSSPSSSSSSSSQNIAGQSLSNSGLPYDEKQPQPAEKHEDYGSDPVDWEEGISRDLFAEAVEEGGTPPLGDVPSAPRVKGADDM